MIHLLFDSISTYLAQSVPELRWVDWDAGQLESPEEHYPIQFPAALIDFSNVEATNEGYGNQQLLVTTQIRLALDVYEDFHIVDGNQAVDRAKAIEHLGIINTVHKSLQGFATNFSNRLSRVGMALEKRDDLLKVYVLYYQCVVSDSNAAQEAHTVEGVGLVVKREG